MKLHFYLLFPLFS